jgi:hypothetical protein
MASDADMHHPTGGQFDQEEGVERAEEHVGHRQEVGRPDLWWRSSTFSAMRAGLLRPRSARVSPTTRAGASLVVARRRWCICRVNAPTAALRRWTRGASTGQSSMVICTECSTCRRAVLPVYYPRSPTPHTGTDVLFDQDRAMPALHQHFYRQKLGSAYL